MRDFFYKHTKLQYINYMKKAIYFILLTALITSCIKNDKFTVKGTVEGGSGETIYLEHTGLLKTTLLDSAEINSKGEFEFKFKKPDYPDFYKLSLLGNQIYFAVDSIETIEISTEAGNFSNQYKISGSESNDDIYKLRASVIAIQKKANEIHSGLTYRERSQKIEELKSMVEGHKKLARPIILKNPRSTAAYFAIYQQVNNSYIFTPYNQEDKPYCAAVATAYNTFMPEYERSKNLYSLVMDAIKRERQARSQAYWQEIIQNEGKGFIDISLPDKNNIIKNLTDLQGKVIMLDFSAYESRESVSYTFALRDLYNEYSSKGFEIFQVSLDRNQMLWKNSVESLPWICVRDTKGPNTPYAASYNISNIPTYFLINRAGEIIGRDLDLETLKREIEKAL